MRHFSNTESTDRRRMSELLGQIAKGETALPEFQRDFVWRPAATRELLISVANNFPAGSLLRLRLQRSVNYAFAPRGVEYAPPLSRDDLNFLVLDGQQRLTSLYSAFYGVGKYRYFLNVQTLKDNNDLMSGKILLDKDDECIFFEEFGSKREVELRADTTQKSELIFPLSIIFGGKGFLDWVFNVVKTNDINLQNELNAVNNEWIKPIEGYEFPVVTLPDSTPVEAVCTIFETLNRTGTKLTTFDLITARLWPQGIKLRDKWKDAEAKYPLLKEYEIGADSLLQVVSLLSKKQCRTSDLLKIQDTNIKSHWDNALEGIKEALQILRDDCGVLTAKWVPYGTMLVTMATVCATTKNISGPAKATRRDKLKRWFWCAVFSQSYEKSANSQIDKDHKSVSSWIDGTGSEPDVVINFKVKLASDPIKLREITPTQRGLYSGLMSLIVSHKTRDFFADAPIDARMIRADDVDDHHIFPRAHLADPKTVTVVFKDDSVNCILNRTLINADTNKKIGRKPPSVYLGTINAGGVVSDKILVSHLLPIGASSPLYNKDGFADFLDWREKEVEKLIVAATS